MSRSIPMRPTLLGAALYTLLAIASCAAFADESLGKLSEDPNQWVMPGGNYSVTRFSRLDQINAQNVKSLRVAWTMSTGTLHGQEGQPLVVGNMMYFESSYPNDIYAVELDHIGQMAWKYVPTQDNFAPSSTCCDVVNRGVAYADGKIVADTLDGEVVALDAKTGKLIWKVKNADPDLGQSMTSAPLIVRDHVLVGVSGGEYGLRGHMTSYNLQTGKREWRAYSTGPDNEMLVDPEKTIDAATQRPVGKDSSLKSWVGDQWKLGGGTTWGWRSYDPNLNLLYYGTGIPGNWNPSQRFGDSKWAMAIFARNPDTGEAAWIYQVTPHERWDYDGVNENILADLDVDGKTVPSLVHFDRNGFTYVLDRTSGKLIAAHKYDPTVNWASGIDLQSGRPRVNPEKMTKTGVNVKGICPASEGDKDQQPVSFDPQTKLFYAPLNHICMDYEGFSVKYKGGFPFVGATANIYPASGDHRGRFIAFDAVSGKTVWEIKDTFQDWSGALTTAGGVAFYGTLDGWFRAIDVNSGKILYQFHALSGIIGNPITYMHRGKQYVAVMTGVGGSAAIGMAAGLMKPTAGLGAVDLTSSLNDRTNLGSRLMVFTLG